MDEDTTVTVANFAVVDILKGNLFESNLRVSVPYIYLTEKDGHLFVPFIKPPFTNDDLQMLPGFLKSADTLAPEDWPKFPCNVIELFGKNIIQYVIFICSLDDNF